MPGPCLCGDPACGRCFPSGQTRMLCTSCGWTGKQCDVGFESDEGLEAVSDGCPQCGSEVVVNEPDDPGFVAFCQEENEL